MNMPNDSHPQHKPRSHIFYEEWTFLLIRQFSRIWGRSSSNKQNIPETTINLPFQYTWLNISTLSTSPGVITTSNRERL
jgi:hypothetical protein